MSRLLAVGVLVVLVAGGAYLAHALTAGWRLSISGLGPPRTSEDHSAGQGLHGPGLHRPDQPGYTQAAAREAADAMAAAIRELGRDTADGRPPVDPRAWADRMAGGQATADPVGPPPGARRLLRMAGGLTFYRLRDGDPEERMAEAVSYYRAALSEGRWHILVDRATGAGNESGSRTAGVGSPGGEGAESGDSIGRRVPRPVSSGRADRARGEDPAGQVRPGHTPERTPGMLSPDSAATPDTPHPISAGHLILAERGSEQVSILVRRRQGAAHAVVRNSQ